MKIEGSILVVDDTPGYALALTRLLQRHGYVAQTAGDGESALHQVRTDPPDLILLDINMPGMNGYETCRRLKADAETSAIPVIFISGEGGVVNKLQAFASGGVDFIVKPHENEEVLARVRTHLALRSLQKYLEARVGERTAELEAANAELARQIVERELAEAALREREARIRRLVEANIIGVMFWNIDGTITDANDAFLRMVAYSRQDMAAGRVRWNRMTPPEYLAATAQAFAELRRNGACPPYEKEYIRQDGSRVPVLVGSALMDGDSQGGISFVIDLSERKGFEQQLLESRQRLRELSAHRDAVREQERKRIAREIHDELGSLLTALKMDISLSRMQAGEDAALQERLAQMRDLVDQTIQMVRQVATQLRPAALNLGIVPALEWLVQEFSQRTGIVCTLAAGDEIEMDDTHATAIFRIVQESLTNITRHAEASHVDVSLLLQGDRIELCIADDGHGFSPDSARDDAFGLLGIRERAQALGTTADIVSTPGTGCTVAISIPFPGETP
ncbi:MAG: response regulator [Rhodocyclaceae bacterium]